MSEPKVFGRKWFGLLLGYGITVALAGTICLLATTAAAQVLYGSMTGTILDGSGASVPGATVTIKDEATGLALSTVTDSNGTYTIRNITGGTYSLRASLQASRNSCRRAFRLLRAASSASMASWRSAR